MDYISVPKQKVEVFVNAYVRSVYNWMFIGLALTGLIAFYTSTSTALLKVLFGNPFMFWGIFIAELAIVWVISSRIDRLSSATATLLYVIYSVLNGLILSLIFLRYTGSSIAGTFFICSVTFLACSIYGWVTKKDLTSFGGFLIMGVIGIIIATIVNIFLKSSALNMAISYIGVFIFIGLTAYDTQKIKNMALSQPDGLEAGVIRKGAILGALALYLDFINLFLFLLRILGGRRD
ncbi:MAG: Bax inhibitor-1/YccA family protein [Desulfobacteraceae bacterium]|nr:MAG: Bax inhibitor-1/YccA family protein [Desulfobacteraceae bacterium]